MYEARILSNTLPNSVQTTRRALGLRLVKLGLVGLASASLMGCGFKLRGNQNFAFSSIAINPNPGGGVVTDLRRAFGQNVQVIAEQAPLTQAQVVLNVVSEQREKVVVGVNASGQVREMQLRIKIKFMASTPKGREILVDDEILQQRDFSYNESAALAKEAEEALLYRDMQSDIVQQLMRRLAAIKASQLD